MPEWRPKMAPPCAVWSNGKRYTRYECWSQWTAMAAPAVSFLFHGRRCFSHRECSTGKESEFVIVYITRFGFICIKLFICCSRSAIVWERTDRPDSYRHHHLPVGLLDISKWIYLMKGETKKKNTQQNALVIFHYEFLPSGIWLSARSTQCLPDNNAARRRWSHRVLCGLNIWSCRLRSEWNRWWRHDSAQLHTLSHTHSLPLPPPSPAVSPVTRHHRCGNGIKCVFGVCRVNENADSSVDGVCSLVYTRVHKHRQPRAAGEHGIHMHWMRPGGACEKQSASQKGENGRNN